MLDLKTPGVYIQELPAAGPISGVGTSTAAFVGPALKGPINVPTKIVNWTQFKDTFGEYITAPRHYLAYAVRGFFDNGGTVCYVTRVGTAARAWLDLDDRGGPAGKAIHIEALAEGTAGNGITVEVQDAQIVDAGKNAAVLKTQGPIASAANNVITMQNLADAAKFRAGDEITIDGTNERAVIARIRGVELTLATNLNAAHNAGDICRLADLVANQTSFRVVNPAGLEPGSVIQLDDGTNQEDLVVKSLIDGRVTVEGAGLTQGYSLDPADPAVDITSYEFALVITPPVGTPETFPELSMDPRHSRYYGRIVQSAHIAARPPDVPSVQPPPKNRPAVIAATNLANGSNDDLAAIGLNHYQNALAALEKIDDVSLVCVPDRTDAGGQGAVRDHCEKLADRFAILDSAFGAPPFGAGSVTQQRAAVESARGYAALYYPWIRINDPSSLTGDDTILVPPSGHMAGIYARSDSERGVHKAPANELIRGAVGLERIIDKAEQGELNIEGVDCLRIFPGKARPIVWGARTTAPKDVTAWRYANVRRLFLYVEESIQEGLRWAVFEPNDLGLWKKLERTITEFLTRVWRSGALFGATPSEAFYVKIDEELNPPSVRALGQVIVEIGMAPVRPAEFIVVRIGMWDGGSEVNEA